MSWIEKRVRPRAAIRLEAAYEDAQRQVFLPTRDISEEGVYLYAPDPPEVGAAARLVLDLPGESEILRLTGWVSRRDTGPEPGFVVKFNHEDHVESASSTRRVLRRFIDDTVLSVGESASS